MLTENQKLLKQIAFAAAINDPEARRLARDVQIMSQNRCASLESLSFFEDLYDDKCSEFEEYCQFFIKFPSDDLHEQWRDMTQEERVELVLSSSKPLGPRPCSCPDCEG